MKILIVSPYISTSKSLKFYQSQQINLAKELVKLNLDVTIVTANRFNNLASTLGLMNSSISAPTDAVKPQEKEKQIIKKEEKTEPKEVKKKITNYYSGEQPEYVTRTLDFINNEQYDMDKFYQFIRTTKFGDTYRKENFVETFPTLYKFIEEYWNGIQ